MGGLAAFSGLPLAGAVSAAAARVKKLAYDLGEIGNLKSRVDELLRDFNESQAAPTKISDGWLQQASLGGTGFKEAEYLYASYNIVREELENFSKVLGLQMESMKLAIHASEKGYQNIDDDVRDRMKALNAQIVAMQNEDDKSNAGPKAQQPSGAGAGGQGGFDDE
ncbi:hypothetical protein ACLGI4_18570 [Streptomyces sp. HMX112]|uniref:hypothetical protein n=1 Tax=Streptomyces sp. HMX112 TaxID=3390850 RepID=UPI003A80D441